jgi:ribonuclease P protein component
LKGENIFIIALPNKKGLRRIVVNVSSKIGKAVLRNRIKRIYKEIFRKNKEIFPESYDIIISPMKDVSSLSEKILIDELLMTLSNLKKEGNF